MEKRIHELERQLEYEIKALDDGLEGKMKDRTEEEIENLKLEIAECRKHLNKSVYFSVNPTISETSIKTASISG
jgi:uncharacterized FlaG/YvyC family protein